MLRSVKPPSCKAFCRYLTLQTVSNPIKVVKSRRGLNSGELMIARKVKRTLTGWNSEKKTFLERELHDLELLEVEKKTPSNVSRNNLSLAWKKRLM